MEGMTTLVTSDFNDYIAKNDGIVLFHKKLCPHCKVIEGVLAKCKVSDPSINLACVDSEEELDLMASTGVERVPTVVVIKGGAIKAKKTGIMNPKEMMAFYQNA